METASQPVLRECDVIMKGGITSGGVYPNAVVELSRAYRFRNIGGTSAGAIAAAVTAAAEAGRTLPGGGFDRLAVFVPLAVFAALQRRGLNQQKVTG